MGQRKLKYGKRYRGNEKEKLEGNSGRKKKYPKTKRKKKTNEQDDKENYEKERQKSILRGNIMRKTKRGWK